MDFLNNLEELMRLKDINRSELARGIGLSTSTVNSWFNRSYENISLKTLKKLSKYFGVTLEELVYGKNGNKLTFNSNQFTTEQLDRINEYARFIKHSKK